MTGICGVCGARDQLKISVVKRVPMCVRCKNEHYRAKRETVAVASRPVGRTNGTARREAEGPPPPLKCCESWGDHWARGIEHIMEASDDA